MATLAQAISSAGFAPATDTTPAVLAVLEFISARIDRESGSLKFTESEHSQLVGLIQRARRLDI